MRGNLVKDSNPSPFTSLQVLPLEKGEIRFLPFPREVPVRGMG